MGFAGKKPGKWGVWAIKILQCLRYNRVAVIEIYIKKKRGIGDLSCWVEIEIRGGIFVNVVW